MTGPLLREQMDTSLRRDCLLFAQRQKARVLNLSGSGQSVSIQLRLSAGCRRRSSSCSACAGSSETSQRYPMPTCLTPARARALHPKPWWQVLDAFMDELQSFREVLHTCPLRSATRLAMSFREHIIPYFMPHFCHSSDAGLATRPACASVETMPPNGTGMST